MITTLQLKLSRKLSKKHLYKTQTSIHILTAFPRIYKVSSHALITCDRQRLSSLKLTRLKVVDANRFRIILLHNHIITSWYTITQLSNELQGHAT